MRTSLPDKLEAGRLTQGCFASTKADGAYGVFEVHGPCGERLMIIASAGDDAESQGWEHVSVSLKRRIPNWLEMCFVKELFWSDDECVVQFHPPKSEYVNNCSNCLHLWRHKTEPFKTPPKTLVGYQTLGTLK